MTYFQGLSVGFAFIFCVFWFLEIETNGPIFIVASLLETPKQQGSISPSKLQKDVCKIKLEKFSD